MCCGCHSRVACHALPAESAASPGTASITRGRANVFGQAQRGPTGLQLRLPQQSLPHCHDGGSCNSRWFQRAGGTAPSSEMGLSPTGAAAPQPPAAPAPRQSAPANVMRRTGRRVPQASAATSAAAQSGHYVFQDPEKRTLLRMTAQNASWLHTMLMRSVLMHLMETVQSFTD